MKIVKKGHIPDVKKEFECPICGTVFICNKDEYREYFERNDRHSVSTCPICNSLVYRKEKE